MKEAEIEAMPFADKGRGQKPRNAGDQLKLEKSKEMDSALGASGGSQPCGHPGSSSERLTLDF